MRIPVVTLALALLGSAGCAHQGPYTWVHELPEPDSLPPQHRFALDDQVLVTVWNQPQLSGTHRVRSDGMVTMPLIGDVALVGLSPDDAAVQIARALDGLVLEPKVTVELLASRLAQVAVMGEVRSPGRYELHHRDGVLELLGQAGGFTEFADRDSIYVLRRDAGVTRIRFRYQQLVDGDPKAVGFALRDGDVLVVE